MDIFLLILMFLVDTTLVAIAMIPFVIIAILIMSSIVAILAPIVFIIQRYSRVDNSSDEPPPLSEPSVTY